MKSRFLTTETRSNPCRSSKTWSPATSCGVCRIQSRRAGSRSLNCLHLHPPSHPFQIRITFATKLTKNHYLRKIKSPILFLSPIPRALPREKPRTTKTMEWTKKQYNSYYNAYMPWIEDKVLGYWGENKTSYTAKGNQPASFCTNQPSRHHLTYIQTNSAPT